MSPFLSLKLDLVKVTSELIIPSWKIPTRAHLVIVKKKSFTNYLLISDIMLLYNLQCNNCHSFLYHWENNAHFSVTILLNKLYFLITTFVQSCNIIKLYHVWKVLFELLHFSSAEKRKHNYFLNKKNKWRKPFVFSIPQHTHTPSFSMRSLLVYLSQSWLRTIDN